MSTIYPWSVGFFKPPYDAPSGWVGVYLDKRPSWSTVGDLLTDAYLLTAPKDLVVKSGLLL